MVIDARRRIHIGHREIRNLFIRVVKVLRQLWLFLCELLEFLKGNWPIHAVLTEHLEREILQLVHLVDLLKLLLASSRLNLPLAKLLIRLLFFAVTGRWRTLLDKLFLEVVLALPRGPLNQINVAMVGVLRVAAETEQVLKSLRPVRLDGVVQRRLTILVASIVLAAMLLE